jgi:Arc/MetJ-type ribon-helix-helix transcriptional regulator
VATITIRTDKAVDEALDALTSEDKDRSDAIREAILLAYREQRHAQLRAEAGLRRRRSATTQRTWPPPGSSTPRWSRRVRGDSYPLRAPKDARGHERDGDRYAVVVQADHTPLPTWLVALPPPAGGEPHPA